MIFAHAPLGYLTTYVTKRWWSTTVVTTRARRWLYAVAVLGGIFPDIDLFYFYWFNASLNHRQFLTHSLLPYLIIMSVGFVCVKLGSQKIKNIGALLILFTIGVYSHFLADAWVGRLVLLYPFSTSLIGLSSWSWYANSIFLQYSLTTNYTAEFLIFVIAGYTIVQRKIWYVIMSLILAIGVVTGLIWLDQHTYKTNSVFAYNDNDGDGIINVEDADLDGDGIMNSRDADADNDGQSNQVELEQQRDTVLDSYYDITNGAFIQIPLRIGLVNDRVLINRLYTNIGISLPAELVADYAQNQTGYESNPKDYQFVENVHNWKTWFQHHNAWVESGDMAAAQKYDVLFFESGHVALWDGPYQPYSVITVSAQQPFTKAVSLFEVEAQEGKVIGVGKVLPD